MSCTCDWTGCEAEGQVGLPLPRARRIRWLCQDHLQALMAAAARRSCSLAEQAKAAGVLRRSRQAAPSACHGSVS